MEKNAKLVQDLDGGLRLSLWDRIRSRFRRTRIVPVPLEFHVDYRDGYHEIRVFRRTDEEQVPVRSIKEIWRHGFVWESDKVKPAITQDDLETLLALRSLNPQVDDEGVIRSEVFPSILRYLREQKTIEEGAESKEIRIAKELLQRRAEVSFDSSNGICIRTGYQVPKRNALISKGDLIPSPDPEFVRIEGSFYPTPIEEDEKIRELIDKESILIRIDHVPDFFKRDLVFLKANFDAVLTEEVTEIEIIDHGMIPHVNIDIGEKGWLDFQVEYQVGEYIIPHDLFKKSSKGYLRLDDNTWIKVDEHKLGLVEKELDSLGYDLGREGFKTDITKFLTLEEFVAHIGGVKEVSREYQQFLDELTDFTYNKEFELPADTEKTLLENGIRLRDYQRAGIHWLNWLSGHYLHGLLADDMGLGKTIQTVVALKLRHDAAENRSHSLIICPRSVVRHWSREIRRVWPESKVVIHLGTERSNWWFKREDPQIFITTYATASNDIDFLKQVPFFALVLDEGTKIKNPQTKRAKAVKQINALHRFALSGTPIENRPAELWSIFDFLIKGHLGSYGGFISKIERPIVGGDEETSEFLAKRIRPFILRRLKEDVAEELPEKIVMEEWCELTEEQKSLYGQIQDRYVSPVRRALLRGEQVSYPTTILPIITKLKQVCDHPALITGKKRPLSRRSEKFDLICDKILNVVDNSEQTVLFSHFLGTLDLFEDYLHMKNIRYVRIDGSTRNRQRLVDQFNEGVTVALLSLMAAGHGINMTAANHVIHVDRWWNPAIEDQATDRVHRIGQDKTVYVHHTLTEGTLEERIDKLLEKKRGISDAVVGAATTGPLQWTREEILELLEPIGI